MNEKLADLIVAAESNDADAQYELYGYIYGGDDLSEGDKRQIVDWLQRSAKMGNAMNMYYLGSCYTEGFVFDVDLKGAFDWFVESAKAGYNEAFYSVGKCYKDGLGVEKDYAKAIEWFEEAIDKFEGHRDSEKELGSDLGEEYRADLAWWEAVAVRSVRYSVVPFLFGNYYYMLKDPDLLQAIRFYKLGAEQGYGHSQYVLGKFYYTGEGVEKDPALALHWLEKAAQQDVAPAMYYLGKLYADDQSVAFDMDNAVLWWRRSLNLGDCEAPGLVELELSWCLALGFGADQFKQHEDEKVYEYRAIAFLLQADDNISTRTSIAVDEDSWWYRYVKQEDAHALYWMGMCYQHVKQLVPPGGGNKEVCTLDCFRKAAETGHVKAQHSVAWFLCHGPRGVHDQEEGIRWYRLAAAKGHPDAIEQLEEIEATSKKS
jgi:TPR repeat protein